MPRLAVLRKLSLGSPVAELDGLLVEHFIRTETLHGFVAGRYDILVGEKGSGKSAILKIVREAQVEFPQLRDVFIVEASNQEHLGNPVFRDVFEEFQTKKVDLTGFGPQLMDAWKVYVLSLLWNRVGESLAPGFEKDLLGKWKSLSLVEGNLLSQLRFAFARVLYPKTIEAQMSAEGVFTGRVELPEKAPEQRVHIPFAELFVEINLRLRSQQRRVWVMFDRLDETFPGNEQLESAAIKSILDVYKDLSSLSNVALKIGLREDLLGRAASQGFRAFDHIRPRMSPSIRWDDADLLNLITGRFLENAEVRLHFRVRKEDVKKADEVEEFFYRLCPRHVDTGTRKPPTWTWVRNRITDGQGLRTPRDALSFFILAQAAQIRLWDREGEAAADEPLFERDVFRLAYAELSRQKFNDQLVSEHPHLEAAMRAFKEQKARHSPVTLESLLGPEWKPTAERLVRVGFLAEKGSSYEVPLLYRPALKITQGAAASQTAQDEDDG